MKFRYLAVDQTPIQLEAGVIYVNADFELATLLCPCGCGHKIVLLCPDGHTVNDENGFATVCPSIGVWDASCKSHFYVRRGFIDWCKSWSDSEIQETMLAQRERHISQESAIPRPWYVRFWVWLKKWWV